MSNKKEKTTKQRRCCNTCHGSDQNINNDFCPECGEPSAEYKKFIYEEEIAKGWLSSFY